jgi:hypothetical protein
MDFLRGDGAVHRAVIAARRHHAASADGTPFARHRDTAVTHMNPQTFFARAVAVVALSSTLTGCAAQQQMRQGRRTQVDAGEGSLEATRRALEGSWALASLEMVDANGSHQPVPASGRLTYDAFGTMTIRGVIEDPALKDKLVLDYHGRIVIDTTRLEFRAADLESDRPVDFDRIAAISPDKVRRYELSSDTLIVTYLDGSGKPAAVARWRRETA